MGFMTWYSARRLATATLTDPSLLAACVGAGAPASAAALSPPESAILCTPKRRVCHTG